MNSIFKNNIITTQECDDIFNNLISKKSEFIDKPDDYEYGGSIPLKIFLDDKQQIFETQKIIDFISSSFSTPVSVQNGLKFKYVIFHNGTSDNVLHTHPRHYFDTKCSSYPDAENYFAVVCIKKPSLCTEIIVVNTLEQNLCSEQLNEGCALFAENFSISTINQFDFLPGEYMIHLVFGLAILDNSSLFLYDLGI